MNFRAVLGLPKTAGSAQIHKSASFIWIVWSTLYVYLWIYLKTVLVLPQRLFIYSEKQKMFFICFEASIKSLFRGLWRNPNGSWYQFLRLLANMATSGGHFSRPSGMGSFWSYSGWKIFEMAIIRKEWQYSERMTLIWKEWH